MPSRSVQAHCEEYGRTPGVDVVPRCVQHVAVLTILDVWLLRLVAYLEVGSPEASLLMLPMLVLFLAAMVPLLHLGRRQSRSSLRNQIRSVLRFAQRMGMHTEQQLCYWHLHRCPTLVVRIDVWLRCLANISVHGFGHPSKTIP